MPKKTPCDIEPFECPYDAVYSEHCRYYCGLGVDEDEPEDYHESEETDFDYNTKGEQNND